MSRSEERREFVDMLVKVYGMDYAFGWLRQNFCVPAGEEINDAVVRKVSKDLLLELIKQEKPNV